MQYSLVVVEVLVGVQKEEEKREGRRKRVRMTESERLAGTLGKVKVR